MAQGRTDISKLNDKRGNISGLNNTVLKDCWNTFQFVTKSLEEWKNETNIGEQMVKNSNTLSNCLLKLTEEIDKLVNEKATAFLEEQRRLNRD